MHVQVDAGTGLKKVMHTIIHLHSLLTSKLCASEVHLDMSQPQL